MVKSQVTETKMTHSISNKSFRTISLALCLIALLLAASFGFNQRVAAMISPAVAAIVTPYKLDAPTQVVLYRGDAHRTGAYDLPGLRAMTRVRWQLPVGEITHGPPVLANGIIYLMSSMVGLRQLTARPGVMSGHSNPPRLSSLRRPSAKA
jgi:hypothetical protein